MLLLMMALASAFTGIQRSIVRKSLALLNRPMVAVIDSVQGPGSPDYTDASDHQIYIDAERFRCCPNSFHNTLEHECAHVKGAEHNDGSVLMRYAVSVNERGEIQEDSFVL